MSLPTTPVPENFQRGSGLESPALDGVAITPADGSDLAAPVRFIYVGGGGALKITTIAGTELTFAGLIAGTILPFAAKKVFATGTTATSLIGGF